MATSEALMALVGRRPLSVLALAKSIGGPAYWLKLRGAREAAARGEWARAIAQYDALLAIKPAAAVCLRGLESAALRGARQAQEKGQWLDACRMWVKFDEATAETDKSIRNLAYCARRIAHAADTPGQMSDALTAWRCLARIDPSSKEAKRGIEWSLLFLMRAAAQRSDAAAAEAFRRELADLSAGEGSFAARNFADWSKPSAGGGSAAAKLRNGLLRKADAARDSRDWAKAAELYRAALKLDPRSAALWMQYGHMLKEAGDSVGAKCAYERAAMLHPENPDIHLQLGHLFKITRKKHQAIQAYSHALELDPTLKDAAQELALLGESQRVDKIIGNAAVNSRRPGMAGGEYQGRERTLTHADPANASMLWRTCEPHLRDAEQYAERADVENALKALTDFQTSAGTPTEDLYALTRDRLSRVLELLLVHAADRGQIKRALARLVVWWLDDRVRRGFVEDNFADLFRDAAAVARYDTVSASSRLVRLRDFFFEHDLERHRGGDPESLESDPSLCGAALRYLRELSRWLPPDSAPLPSWVADRLTRNALSLQAGQSLTTLMTYASMAERPPVDFSSASYFEEFGAWYLLNFVPDRHIPSACIGEAIVRDFNGVISRHKAFGVSVTKFLQAAWAKSDFFRSRYDLNNPLDCLLLSLEIIGTSLPDAPQHRVFLREIIPTPEPGAVSLAEECIAVLTGDGDSGTEFRDKLFAAIRDNVEPVQRSFSTEENGAQDVLLIGHAGKGTGLGRNFEMLRDALQMDGIALQHLDYDLDGSVFGETLEQWARRCRSKPIVVLAVNAQDVPTIFAKDRSGILLDSYVVGFFLWETSDVPRVQRLGLDLVDEVWTPTQYVADIYAPFVRTHLVGKALSDGAHSDASAIRKQAGAPFTFLMVFDFHSSIERKNPLAAALAFQQAFPADENVHLIIKTSNVNPSHWSNALGHWEQLGRVWISDNRIKVVNARYSDEQMLQLMQETSCFVSLHRSEGFGYVIADAMLQEIPVVATNYSGNVDFCTAETFFPVPYTLKPVDERVMHWKAGKAEWADPDLESAAAQMRHVFDHYEEALRVAKRGREYILARYSMEKFRGVLQNRIAMIESDTREHCHDVTATLQYCRRHRTDQQVKEGNPT